jgi:hypothetical protein
MRITLAMVLVAGCFPTGASSESKDPPAFPNPPATTPPDPTVSRGQLSGDYGADDAVFVMDGLDAENAIGWAVAAAGDLDGDGVRDLIVGTTRDDSQGTDNGAVYVLPGPFAGEVDLGSAVAKYTGEGDQAHIGWVAEAIGDVNGDGQHDLVGQGHRYDDHHGLVFVAFGPVSGTHLGTDADIVLTGVDADMGFGLDIAPLGDVNGDGRADLAAAASIADVGTVYVWHQSLVAGAWTTDSADAVLVSESSGGDGAGGTLAGGRDLSGDGLPDLVIGDFWYDGGAGAVYEVDAPFAGTAALDAADRVHATDTSATGGMHTFFAIEADAGDMDGDGLAEVVAASCLPYEAYVFGGGVGPTTDLTDATATVTFNDGSSNPSLSVAGDVDGDGTDDLLASEMPFEDGGSAWLFYGPFTGALALADASAVFSDEGTTYGRLGIEARGGDVDGDGYADLLIGSLDGANEWAGAILAFSGP